MNLYPAPIVLEAEDVLGQPNRPLDAHGVVMVRVKSSDGYKPRYNPTTIAQFAMANYNLFVRSGAQRHREAMEKQVTWLSDNFVRRGGFGVWEYDYDYTAPGYDCGAPWISCMAQGQGISAIIRSELVTPGLGVETTSKLAAGAFEVPLGRGGVRTSDAEGCSWYKEFACARSPIVLNGMIFGMFGLKECADSFGDEGSMRSFAAGVATLKKHLRSFEVGVYPFFKWSRYDDKLLVLSRARYHKIHVGQLELLSRMTGDSYFHEIAARWERYLQLYEARFPFGVLRDLSNGVARVASSLGA